MPWLEGCPRHVKNMCLIASQRVRSEPGTNNRRTTLLHLDARHHPLSSHNDIPKSLYNSAAALPKTHTMITDHRPLTHAIVHCTRSTDIHSQVHTFVHALTRITRSSDQQGPCCKRNRSSGEFENTRGRAKKDTAEAKQ